ncbi:MAG: carbon-nitrogen hydrolase family protein [Rhodospirillales bacterium]|nr:carbon-nitrogen hydrolase family protein [Rhodospirillales bacterium]
MASRFTAACLQLNSKRDIKDNISEITTLLDDAVGAGADLITLPECTGLMEPNGEALRKKAPAEEDHPVLALIRGKAAETACWILIGSLAVKLPDGKIANRSYLIGPDGGITATYDKIHMFDVALGDGQYYRESETYEPGTDAVIADTPWGRVGLTICYDVRFAYLYRTLAQQGADFLTIPAAFTKVSGEAHWHVLQRARAIETGCYVIAAAQCGTHAENRQTFGHSLIVDPWGTVLADGGNAPGVITATIDPAQVTDARSKIPSLTHDRDYGLSGSRADNI